MAKKGLNKKVIVAGGLFFLAILVGVIVYLNRTVFEGLATQAPPSPQVPATAPTPTATAQVPATAPTATATAQVPAATAPSVPVDCPTGQQNIDGQCVNTSSMLKSSAKLLLQYLGENAATV
jgi:uncharacterized iron-regulated membrane protein